MNPTDKQIKIQEALKKLLVRLEEKTFEQEKFIKELKQLLEKENYGKS
jgi:uncharacterized coiled-coil protein SlyX